MDNRSSSTGSDRWHHAPLHLFLPNRHYIITGATLDRVHIFDSDARLDLVLQSIQEESQRFGWGLEAWAVFPNHYHLVARAPESASSLPTMIKAIHAKTATQVNEEDGAAGRRVWFQYWDTCLTFEKSYYARLKYVHRNAEKHGVTRRAEDYRWCSAAWFSANAPEAERRKIEKFRIDRVNVPDDF